MTEKNLTLEANPDESDECVLAKASLSPEVRASMTISSLPHQLSGTNLNALVDQLTKQQEKIRDGSLSLADEILASQAQTLDAIFHSLTTMAFNSTDPNHLSLCLKLAFKAQNQSRSSLETIANIKNPSSVAFVRQANIGQAVQVNNGITQAPIPSLLSTSDSSTQQIIEGENFNVKNELLKVTK